MGARIQEVMKKIGSGGRERGQEVAFDEWTKDLAAWEMNYSLKSIWIQFDDCYMIYIEVSVSYTPRISSLLFL